MDKQEILTINDIKEENKNLATKISRYLDDNIPFITFTDTNAQPQNLPYQRFDVEKLKFFEDTKKVNITSILTMDNLSMLGDVLQLRFFVKQETTIYIHNLDTTNPKHQPMLEALVRGAFSRSSGVYLKAHSYIFEDCILDSHTIYEIKDWIVSFTRCIVVPNDKTTIIHYPTTILSMTGCLVLAEFSIFDKQENAKNNIYMRGCIFKSELEIRGSNLYASFENTSFFNANFMANFQRGCSFTDCIFEGDTLFTYSEFSGRTYFHYSKFKEAYFKEVKFNSPVDFSNVIFHKRVSFKNALFKDEAKFQNTTFMDFCDFSGSTFNNYVAFHYTNFLGKALFRNATFRRLFDFSYADIGKANFYNIHHQPQSELKNFLTENIKQRERFINEKEIILPSSFKETCRLIKNSASSQEDFITANRFYSLEMMAFLLINNEPKNAFKMAWYDKVVLWFNGAVSDHYQNRWKALLCWLISIMSFTSLALIIQYGFDFNSFSWKEAFSFDNTITKLNCAIDIIECDLRAIMVNILTPLPTFVGSRFATYGHLPAFIIMFGKIFTAFIFYQFIISLRKNSRK